MKRFVFYGLLLAGIAFRVAMLLHYDLVSGGDVDVYLADEGVVGLMGKHILEGRELPIFFYGQAYLGALEAYCVAASFALFGVGFPSMRLVPFAFSVVLLLLVYRFTRSTFSVDAARWATALTAVAPMYFLQWNLKARGGFVEHIVLLFAVLILFWRFYANHERSNAIAVGLGFTAGIALWVNQLMIAYVVVLGALLALSSDRRGLKAAFAGLMLGSSLLVAYNLVHPLATVRALGRKAVVLNRVPAEQRDEQWILRGVGQRFRALSDGAAKLGLVFGVPPDASVERLGLSEEIREGGKLTSVRRWLWWVPAGVFGLGVVAARPRRGLAGWEPLGPSQFLLVLLAVTFVVGYVSPRYMLPAFPLAAITVGALAARLPDTRKPWLAAAVAAVLAFHVASWADAATSRGEDSERTGVALLAFLEEHGLGRCYSAAPLYHLVFRSEERVVMAPLQKDRYPKYNDEIEASDSICYVFRDDQADKRQHVAMLGELAAHSVTYRSESIGPYTVFWDFSPRGALTREAMERIRSPRDPKLLLGAATGLEGPWT